MPKFLEDKLKAKYGQNSDVPYKIMNSIGAMRGSKETPKGAAMEKKHEADTGKKGFFRGGATGLPTAGAGSGSGRLDKAEDAKSHPKGFRGGGSTFRGSRLTAGRPPGKTLRALSDNDANDQTVPPRGFCKGGGVELRGAKSISET